MALYKRGELGVSRQEKEMIAALVEVLLTLKTLIVGDPSTFDSSRKPRKSIWSSIWRNAVDLKKLTRAINETQFFEEEFGPNVLLAKHGQRKMWTIWKRALPDHADGANEDEHRSYFQQTSDEYNFQEDGVVYMYIQSVSGRSSRCYGRRRKNGHLCRY